MKKTYFTRRDDEGKIFDKGFCIEASNEKDAKKMDAVANYLENIYGENFTYIDGVIRVHCAADLRGIDLRVFKTMFNDDYKAAKKHAAEYKEETAEPAASIEPEPAAKEEKPLTITRYNEGRGKHFDFVRVTGGSVEQFRRARSLVREKMDTRHIIEGFDYIDVYGTTTAAVEYILGIIPAKKVRRRNAQMVKICKNNPSYDSFRKNVCRYSFHRSYAALRQAKKRGGDAKKQGKYSIVLRYLTPFYKVA